MAAAAHRQQPLPPAGLGAGLRRAVPGVASNNKGATASLVLGIVSIVSLVLRRSAASPSRVSSARRSPGLIGAKAKREIAQQPGVYGNLAQAG